MCNHVACSWFCSRLVHMSCLFSPVSTEIRFSPKFHVSFLFRLQNYTCLPFCHEVSPYSQHGLFVWLLWTAREAYKLVDSIGFLGPCRFFQKIKLTYNPCILPFSSHLFSAMSLSSIFLATAGVSFTFSFWLKPNFPSICVIRYGW